MFDALAARLSGRRARWSVGVLAAVLVLAVPVTWAVTRSGDSGRTSAVGAALLSGPSRTVPGDEPSGPSASASASSSAAPSASASPSAGTGPVVAGSRSAGAPGTVKPGPGNTGVPPGTRLTQHRGDITVTTPGTVLDALDIHGFVRIRAPNVKITRSIVRGGPAPGGIGLISNIAGTGANLVVEDSELVPEFPSRLIDAITGADFTMRRVNAHGTVDTTKVFGNNVRIESSWLHDTVVFQHDPDQDGGPTHNDGVQVLGGRNIRIVGNAITGARNAGIQVTQGTGSTTDLEISRNWLDGGGCTVNLSHLDKAASMSGITVTGNRFGRHSTFAGCAIVATSATTVVSTGNVWEDDGTSVGPVRRLK